MALAQPARLTNLTGNYRIDGPTRATRAGAFTTTHLRLPLRRSRRSVAAPQPGFVAPATEAIDHWPVSATAQFCKSAHNLTGLLFPVAVVLVLFAYLREALFNFKFDINWFLRAVGYLGGKHPSSGNINAGHKAWYWTWVVG